MVCLRLHSLKRERMQMSSSLEPGSSTQEEVQNTFSALESSNATSGLQNARKVLRLGKHHIYNRIKENIKILCDASDLKFSTGHSPQPTQIPKNEDCDPLNSESDSTTHCLKCTNVSMQAPKPSLSYYRPGKYLLTTPSPSTSTSVLQEKCEAVKQEEWMSCTAKTITQGALPGSILNVPQSKSKVSRLPQNPPKLSPVPPEEYKLLLSLMHQLQDYLGRRTPCELTQFPCSVLNDHGCFLEQVHTQFRELPKETTRKTEQLTYVLDSGVCSSKAFLQQCIDTCNDAVKSGTFAADYPSYCLRHLVHPPLYSGISYMQGAVLRERDSGRIIAWIYTNARDDISNLKATIVSLRNRRSKNPDLFTTAMEEFAKLTQFDDFFHVNLLVTHSEFRGRGYAKLLLYFSILYWGLRGLYKTYLNMALEKTYNEETGKMECRTSPSSHNLYRSFQFVEVYPKFTMYGTFRWTQAEADMGRVMINLDTKKTIIDMAKLYNFDVTNY